MLEYKSIKLELTGDIVQKAQKQPMEKQTILEKMQKTGNTPFEFESLTIEMEEDIFIPVGALNRLRRDGLEQLEQKILQKYQRKVPQYVPKESVVCSSEESLKLHVLIEEPEQFAFVCEQPEVTRIYMDIFKVQAEHITKAHESGKQLYLAFPYILRKSETELLEHTFTDIVKANPDGCLVRNLEEICFLQKKGFDPKKIQTDYGIYVYSNEAYRALEEWGIENFTLPVELNRSELSELDCENGEMILYGYQPLMISAQCLHKNTAGCDKKPGVFYLKDRYGKLFPVKNNCPVCYNVIYNTSPLVLLHRFRNPGACTKGCQNCFYHRGEKRNGADIFHVSGRVCPSKKNITG